MADYIFEIIHDEAKNTANCQLIDDLVETIINFIKSKYTNSNNDEDAEPEDEVPEDYDIEVDDVGDYDPWFDDDESGYETDDVSYNDNF